MIEQMGEKRFQIVANRGSLQSAWTKAPADVATVASRLGYEMYDIDSGSICRASFIGRVLNKLGLLIVVNRLVFKWHIADLRCRYKKAQGGELLVQHPVPHAISAEYSRLRDVASLKDVGVSITVVVHDIGWFHEENPCVGNSDELFERKLFSIADKLIVHNQQMMAYLRARGFSTKKMVPLKIFDYLINNFDSFARDVPRFDIVKRTCVMIAGGMGGWKASYLENLHSIASIEWNLCGVDYDAARIHGCNVHYLGCFAPEDVPFRMRGDFGLVWHGNSVDTCAGRTGEYLKINNPHKLSLYLASGLPVIIWAQAAEADFVRKYHLGLTVESLHDIPNVIASLTNEHYAKMLKSVRELGDKLRRGDFTCEALNA